MGLMLLLWVFKTSAYGKLLFSKDTIPSLSVSSDGFFKKFFRKLISWAGEVNNLYETLIFFWGGVWYQQKSLVRFKPQLIKIPNTILIQLGRSSSIWIIHILALVLTFNLFTLKSLTQQHISQLAKFQFPDSASAVKVAIGQIRN